MKRDKNNTYQPNDVRLMKPRMIKENNSPEVLTIQQHESITISDSKFIFFTPNNVSVFVSIAKKELSIAKKIYKTVITDTTKKNKEIEVKDRDLSKLYDFFEHIQTSIICAYTAIEALANIAIPNSYKYQIEKKKGITETWNKNAIERWLPTSDKYTKILPDILGIENPKLQGFWSNFKELELIRNNIIHQKSSMKDPNNVDANYIHILLKPSIFKLIESGFELISYISNSDQSHPLFPLGFGASSIKVQNIGSFSDRLEKIN